MITKKTWLNVADQTNVEWLQTFHLYKGFWRKSTSIGFFLKGSVRVIQPPRVGYKGHKFKFNKKGNICRAVVIRQVFPLIRKDGVTIRFRQNAGLLIKKKQNLKSKFSFGPSTILIKRKKFKSIFKTLV